VISLHSKTWHAGVRRWAGAHLAPPTYIRGADFTLAGNSTRRELFTMVGGGARPLHGMVFPTVIVSTCERRSLR